MEIKKFMEDAKMKQYYQVKIEGDKLPDDMSKDIALQLDCGFLIDKVYLIHVKKVEVLPNQTESPNYVVLGKKSPFKIIKLTTGGKKHGGNTGKHKLVG